MRSSAAEPLALLGLALGLVVLIAWRPAPEVAPLDETTSDSGAFYARSLDPAPGPHFAVSGNELGFIRPCGCSKPKLGGIHRRARVIDTWRKADPGLVAIGLGNMITTAGPQARIKFEHFMIAMMIMEYRAYFPGPGELGLGATYLAEQRDAAAFPMVAANVTDAAGAPFFAPSHRLEESGWVLTGLLPATQGLADLKVTPWKDALAATIAALDPEKDHLLVAWNGSEKEARTVAAAVPEAWRARTTIIFGGGYDAPATVRGGDLPVAMHSIGSKGRNLARLRPLAKAPLEGVRLEEAIEGLPDVVAILEGYRMALAEADLIAGIPRQPLEKNYYVGDATCAECHEDIHKQLLATPHQHAWKTLVDYGDHHDPECAKCHVTGWGIESGFMTAEKTPKHVNVNCEACHGPGGLHSDEGETMPVARPTEQSCRVCHDPDNSPKFDYKVYWPKIAHPKK